MEYLEDYATSLYNELKRTNDLIDPSPMYLFTETNQQTGKQKSVTFVTHRVAVIYFLEYCDIFKMQYIEDNGEYTSVDSQDVYLITLTKINS
jgi:hypothetical protein